MRHLYTVLFIFTLFSFSAFSQTGPGGVGSSSSLITWLDASRLPLGNTSPVSIWTDVSGNGVNFTQGTSSEQPSFLTNQINGLPAVGFDGGDLLSVNNSGTFSNESDLSHFIVVSTDAPLSAQCIISTDYSGGGAFAYKWASIFRQGNHEDRYKNDNGTQIKPTSSLSAGFNLRTNIITGNSTDVLSRFINGSPQGTVSVSPFSTNTHSKTVIGRNSITGTWYLDGQLPELIIFREALNEAERIIVENYLAAKYNLTITNDLYAFQATHGNEVAGIGRESATDVNNDAQGTGIVRINNPSSLSDGDYLLFGHDGAALTGTGSSSVTGLENEVARSWVADLNTGDVGTVTVSFDISSFSLGADPAEYRLLFDDDGNFSNGGSTVSTVGPSGSTTITFSGVDMYSDGPYFKLAHTGTATLCSAFFPGDWDNGTIWSCPGFPDSTNNAEIDPGVTVTVTGNESVNDLTLQSNSALVLNPGTSLIIKGDLTLGTGASITADPTSTIIFRGNAGLQTLTNNSGGALSLGNLTINNGDGVDLNDSDYSLSGGLSLTNGDLTVAGNLTFASDGTSHGHVRALNGNSINATAYTTERFMATRSANWNDISSLAIATTISDLDDEIFISGVPGADGYAASTTGGGFISLWYFDNSTQQYVAVGNVNDAMPIGRGYEAWLGDNLSTWTGKAWDFNGATLNQSTTNLSLVSGWNLIGNPLPGFLDFEQLASDNPQINNGEYWHYDANNGIYGTISGAGSFVPPGQGLWLFCTSGFTLMIDPSTHLRTDLNNNNLFKLQSDQNEELQVSVTTKGEGTAFGSAIYLRKDARAFSGVDAMDIPPLKVPDQRAVRMWMDFNHQERMVNYVNTDEEHLEIPLHVESGLSGTFEMNFAGLEYFEDYQCFNLLNEETGEQIEIYPEASYEFTVNEQLDPLNMKLLISKKDYADCLAPTSFSDNEVRVFSNANQINTDFFLDKTAEAEITVLNSLGQVVHKEQATVSYNRNSIDMSDAQSGIYFVNIQINGQSMTEKVILQ